MEKGSSAYYVATAQGSLLASNNIANFIVNLVTIFVASAIACLLLKLGDVFGAGHLAIAATQAQPSVLIKVLSSRKRSIGKDTSRLHILLFWLIVVVALMVQPLILGIHQGLLNHLPTKVVTSYTVLPGKHIVYGDNYGEPFLVDGIPLVVGHPLQNGFPSAGAGAVRGDFASFNTRVISYMDMQSFDGNMSVQSIQGRDSAWYFLSPYATLPPGVLGIQGSRRSIRMSYGNVTEPGANYLTLDLTQDLGVAFETSMYFNTFLNSKQGVCNFTAIGVLNNTAISEPVGMEPTFVRCFLVNVKSANGEVDSGYAYCTVLFLANNINTNMNETFIVVEKIFQSPTGLLSAINFSRNHRIGAYDRFDEFPVSVKEYKQGFPSFISHLNNSTGRGKWAISETRTWKSEWNVNFKFDRCVRYWDNDPSYNNYLYLPLGDRVVARRHSTPTSVAMRLDARAKSVNDMQLYVISDTGFIVACIITIVLSALVLVLLDAPGTIAWALAFKDGFECSTKTPKENFMQQSAWTIQESEGGVKVMLVPKGMGNDNREFGSHAAAVQAMKSKQSTEDLSEEVALKTTYIQL